MSDRWITLEHTYPAGPEEIWELCTTAQELSAEGDGTRVAMTMEPLHDEEWTQRLVAGRENELDNLARVLERG